MVSLHQCNRGCRIATSKFIEGLDLTIQCYYQERDNDLRWALYGIDRFPRHAILKKLRLEFRQMPMVIGPDTSFYEMPSRFITQAANRLTALETLVLGTTWVGMRDVHHYSMAFVYLACISVVCHPFALALAFAFTILAIRAPPPHTAPQSPLPPPLSPNCTNPVGSSLHMCRNLMLDLGRKNVKWF